MKKVLSQEVIRKVLADAGMVAHLFNTGSGMLSFIEREIAQALSQDRPAPNIRQAFESICLLPVGIVYDEAEDKYKSSIGLNTDRVTVAHYNNIWLAWKACATMGRLSD